VSGIRKERIPDRLVAAFAEVVGPLPNGARAIDEVGRGGEGEGIARMYDFLRSKLEGSEEVSDAVTSQPDTDKGILLV